MHYWIVVASKDHISRGVAGGFMQANHGKPGPLKKLSIDDWVIFYSPKETYAGNQPLQAFTAIGQVTGEDVYQYQMSPDFMPYRRDVKFYPCKETPIAPLINDLEFITDKSRWGYQFRFGFFEIGEHDFKLISASLVD